MLEFDVRYKSTICLKNVFFFKIKNKFCRIIYYEFRAIMELILNAPFKLTETY